MKKIKLLFLFVVLTFIACRNEKKINSDQSENKKPNIVIILSDDQGWGDLSINGNTSLYTPHIDLLARSGIRFDRFFVSPVCSPTRAEMLTGRHHVRCGVSGTSAGKERLDLDETTMAEVFKSAGYKTAAYGKWHNGMQAPYHPNSRGFDDYYGFCSGHWGHYFSPMLEHNGEIVKGDGFVIDDFTNRGLSFIERNQREPFFLYLPLNTPHSPMQVPEKWWQKFEQMDISQVGTQADREEIEHTKAALAMCENIDWNVGRIISKLEELDLEKNTIVIYFSDNGPNGHRWNGGMKGVKGSTDEGGVRSPFIINWPGTLKGGRTIEKIAGAYDLLPTLADLANVEYSWEKPLDGVSLAPLLLDRNAPWSDRTLVSYWGGRTSLRTQKFRLGENGQLFDMIGDPNQKIDISSKMTDVLMGMEKEKVAWTQGILSELPEKDNRPFVLGHPDLKITQVPARDALATGGIERSNRYPNDSYFTNWTQVEDYIYWPADIATSGNFEVELYYTCPEESVGSEIELSFNESRINGRITKSHDPPLAGAKEDKYPRIESYVKDFKPMKLGTIRLEKGSGVLKLKALKIPGSQAMEFRLLTLSRI